MNKKHYNAEDEINLIGFKRFIIGMVNELFQFVRFTQRIIIKKFAFIVIGLLLGVACGIYIYYNKPKVFRATMVVMHNQLNKRAYGEVLNQLNNLATTGSHSKLAAALKVPSSYVNGLIFFEARNMEGKLLENDTSSKSKQLFKINVGLLHDKHTDSLQTALLNYLNNLPYFKRVSEVDKRNHLARLDYIDRDLAKLDSLKIEFNRFLSTSKISATIYNNAINPAELYEHSNVLVHQREATVKQLEVESSAVMLIDGFKVTDSPEGRSLLNLVSILGLIGLFTGFLVGLLIETKDIPIPKNS